MIYMEMGEEKPGRKKRTTVSIPVKMHEFIKKLIEEEKLPGGYISVDEFVRDAIRKRLRELGFNV